MGIEEYGNIESDYVVMNQILNYVKSHAKKGNVDSVIEAIDDCCGAMQEMQLMHVGKEKGAILDFIVKETQPCSVLELGAFFGYSALRMARLLKPNAVVYSIEVDSEMAKVASAMADFAGLTNKIKIIVGKSSNIFTWFGKNGFPISAFDFVFIDHHKPLYKSDLLLMEELKLLAKGTVVLADNIVYPGVPDYAEYVRNSFKYKSTTFQCKCYEPGEAVDDEMEKSVYQGE